jgi:hypothetical protein
MRISPHMSLKWLSILEQRLGVFYLRFGLILSWKTERTQKYDHQWEVNHAGVTTLGSGFALLPRDALDGELIESPFHIAKTHGSFVYSKESNLRPTAGPPPCSGSIRASRASVRAACASFVCRVSALSLSFV